MTDLDTTPKWLKLNLITILTIAPIFGAILQALISNLMSIDFYNLFFLMLLFNFALGFQDMERLKVNGSYTSEMGLPWIIPLYLYKRAKAFNQFPISSIIWSILYVSIFFIPADIIKEFVWIITFQYG